MQVTVGILGPVELAVDGVDVTPAAGKERALLALLAVQHPLVVSVHRLTAELWPELPSDRARHVLQVRVAALRKRLAGVGAAGVLESAASGYRLALPASAIDAHRFGSLVERARREASTAGADAAMDAWADALALWRGEPLAGVQETPTLEAEVARLTEARFGAVEAWIDAGLACGRHESLLPELDALVATHPLRERLSGQRVLALYRCDRQAEALRACTSLRRRLVDELGVAPTASLRALEAAVLEQRPELDWTPSRALQERPPPDARPAGPATPVVRSEVRYAKTRDGVHIAYQVAGAGPVDVLVIPGYISHLDSWWDAWSGRLVRRLATFARLIIFDKRGTGLSDRPAGVDVTDWVEDARAVMDDVGSDSVAVLGVSAGCQIAILFAARYPERTQSLVLYGGAARFLPGEDYPFGQPLEVHEDFWARTAERWGSGWGTTFWCPSARGDPEVRAHFGSHQRMSASPGAGVAYLRAITALDVRHALPMVSAPTLVLHAARDVAVPVEMARYVAERITDASLVELDSADHLIWFSDAIDVMTDEIEDFLSGLPGREVRGGTAAGRRAGVHDRHGR